MHPPQGAYVLGSLQTLRCRDWCVLQDAERGSWGTLWYNQNYEGDPWVWWDPGEGPLIHTGLTLMGQTRERRRQGCVFQIEGAAHHEADRKRAGHIPEAESGCCVRSDGDEAMKRPGQQQEPVVEHCRAMREPLPGLRDPWRCWGCRQKWAAEVVGDWQAQQMDHFHGCRVWGESGLGAGEEGSGLQSGQELVDGARV